MRTSLTSSDGGTGTTRILLVDDHEISRAAYRALLRAEGIDVVADLAASDHALAAARALRPDVAIVDVTPGADTGFGIARSSASARCSHGSAPSRRNVSSAARRRTRASVRRRCLRSHSP